MTTETHSFAVPGSLPGDRHPRVLMLGKSWFPAQLGGLDRYFRDLFERQPEAQGLLVGPALDAPANLVVASSHDAPLPNRMLALALASRRLAGAVDVVDAHFALYAVAPLLFGGLRRVPTVVHFHGPWADENVAAGDPSRVRRILRRGLERVVYRRAARIVVLSAAFRRILVERYRVSPWRVRVHPPGVDLERFSPGDRQEARERLAVGDDAFLLVAVRRLVPRMGLDVLIDAWAAALSRLPRGARLLIAGEGDQRSELEGLIERRGVGTSARLLGGISECDLLALYRAADLAVVPTRSFEGFGLVVIEAAACGTPSIVTRVGGLPEAVRHLDPSLVVPPGDVSALAGRIVAAASEDGRPGRAQTRRFAERHTWLAAVASNRLLAREAAAPESTREKLRVVYLDHVAQLSGGEIALLRLVPHLDQVDAHFVLAEDGPFADELIEQGLSVEVLPLNERARMLRKANVTVRGMPVMAMAASAGHVVRLAVRLRRLRPDLVHTNSLKAGFYGSLAGRLAGVPVVWHVRDRIAPDYLPRPAVGLVRFMVRRLAAGVFANSAATLETLGPGVEAAVITEVLPESVVVPSVAISREPGPLRVGIVGRLAPWKGQDLFVKAFADAFPDGDTRCVIVGSAMFGENEYEAGLHALVVELGVEDRVDFRGFRRDIWSELARLDVLVHASRIPEPFGQVILEAMAARVPVICANAGGPSEMVRHNINGLLYQMGHQAALARAMRELADDESRRARLVAAATVTAAEHHPSLVAGRVHEIYRRVARRVGEGR